MVPNNFEVDKEDKKVLNYTELKVYKLAFKSAIRIFELSKKWPQEERYSLIDQIRR